MLQIFRKLDKKRNWDSQNWLVEGQAPADALKDLATKGNKLSIFLIDETQVVEALKKIVNT